MTDQPGDLRCSMGRPATAAPPFGLTTIADGVWLKDAKSASPLRMMGLRRDPRSLTRGHLSDAGLILRSGPVSMWFLTTPMAVATAGLVMAAMRSTTLGIDDTANELVLPA